MDARLRWAGAQLFIVFLFTSFSKSFFIVLFATYSVNVNFRDYSYMLIAWILYFHAITGATHSCIMHDTGRGTFCKNADRSDGRMVRRSNPKTLYKNTKNIRPIISLRLVDFYVIYIRVCFISQVKSSV